jgi:hypothetical protein
MNDLEPNRRPFQYSLWSLFVLTTLVAVLCSFGVCCTDWSVPIVLVVGIGFCFIGYGPLSLRKHPTMGCGYVVLGFLVRLIGLAIISFGIFLLRMRSHP